MREQLIEAMSKALHGSTIEEKSWDESTIYWQEAREREGAAALDALLVFLTEHRHEWMGFAQDWARTNGMNMSHGLLRVLSADREDAE